jgi:hypothetical protein
MGHTAVAIRNEARGRMVATELNTLAKATGAPKVLADAAQTVAWLLCSVPAFTGERCAPLWRHRAPSRRFQPLGQLARDRMQRGPQPQRYQQHQLHHAGEQQFARVLSLPMGLEHLVDPAGRQRLIQRQVLKSLATS